VDFVGYADRSATLVNAALHDRADLEELLEDRTWLLPGVADRDLSTLRRLQRELRPVFEASARGDEQEVVARLNALFARHPVTPYIAGHDAQSWHLHVADRASSVAQLLTAEALVGLAAVVCELGAARFGTCQASSCSDVFVDTSPNASRRYCSERCASRANVAAYRARQKASKD
jgi:predicted RNA-binding Zn ribbon-like protein